MKLNEEGVFHAIPAEIGVSETRDNNLATAAILFKIIEAATPEGFVDISGDMLDIVGYFYLEKKDGTLNDFTVSALRTALGWDGCDIDQLQNADYSDHPVQITVAWDEYMGKTRLKVQWLNPYGSAGGGIVKAGAEDMKRLSNRLGSKLRAISGGSPVARPTPPAGRPAPAKTSPPICTMEDAWASFTNYCPENWTQADIEKEWFRIIEVVVPGVEPANIQPAQWAQLKSRAVHEIVPF